MSYCRAAERVDSCGFSTKKTLDDCFSFIALGVLPVFETVCSHYQKRYAFSFQQM